MKHLYFVLISLLTVYFAAAQTKIAVKGGWNYSTARVADNAVKQPNSYKNGAGIGILFKVPFDHTLHFSPYFAYNLRGFSYRPVGIAAKYNYTIHYIDLVPALSFDLPFKNNFIVLSLGPQFGIALAGTEKITAGGTTISNKMKFSTEGDYSRIDAGLSSSIGYHLKKIFFEAGYQLGLANINNNVDIVNEDTGVNIDPRNIRHRMFSLNIGYYLK